LLWPAAAVRGNAAQLGSCQRLLQTTAGYGRRDQQGNRNLMAKRLDLPMSDVDWPALWAEFALATDFSLWHRNEMSPAVKDLVAVLTGPSGRARLAADGVMPPAAH